MANDNDETVKVVEAAQLNGYSKEAISLVMCVIREIETNKPDKELTARDMSH